MRRNWFWRLCQTVEHWVQRRTRGWDDSDLWNLDRSLALLILPRLKRFAADLGGIPGDLTEEQWSADLATMIRSFEMITDESYWDMSIERDAEIQRGLDLFAKWFRALWT